LLAPPQHLRRKKHLVLWTMKREARKKRSRADPECRKESGSREKEVQVTPTWREKKEMRSPITKTAIKRTNFR